MSQKGKHAAFRSVPREPSPFRADGFIGCGARDKKASQPSSALRIFSPRSLLFFLSRSLSVPASPFGTSAPFPVLLIDSLLCHHNSFLFVFAPEITSGPGLSLLHTSIVSAWSLLLFFRTLHLASASASASWAWNGSIGSTLQPTTGFGHGHGIA